MDGVKIEKEEIKLPLFAEEKIGNVENTNKYLNKHLISELISELNKVTK